MDSLKSALCVCAALAAAPCAHADQYNVFAKGPAAAMTKADFDVARVAVRDALDHASDNETRAWSNAATGASGSITPRRSFKQDQLGCREAHFETKAGGKSGSSEWILCKHGEEWKVHGAPPSRRKSAAGAGPLMREDA